MVQSPVHWTKTKKVVPEAPPNSPNKKQKTQKAILSVLCGCFKMRDQTKHYAPYFFYVLIQPGQTAETDLGWTGEWCIASRWSKESWSVRLGLATVVEEQEVFSWTEQDSTINNAAIGSLVQEVLILLFRECRVKGGKGLRTCVVLSGSSNF